MWKQIGTMVLAALLVMGSAPALAAEDADMPSAWAAEEYERALALDFVPEALRGDCRAPMTRAEFARLSLYFLRRQYQWNPASEVLDSFIEEYCARHVFPDGSKLDIRTYVPDYQEGTMYRWSYYIKNAAVFTDVPWEQGDCNLAHAFGIVDGKGDGTFDPDGAITRQEAAAMLLRTYRCYADEAEPAEAGLPPFPDEAEIADWARDNISVLRGWGVMEGTADGSFRPLDTYTREQCIVTFLRLFDCAPISQARGNIAPLVPYEELLDRLLEKGLEWSADVTTIYRDEGELCSVVVQTYGGVMHAPINPYVTIVYRSGGYRQLEAAALNTIKGGAFSADGHCYSFENRSGGGFDETLLLDLSTGRFIENE